MAKKPSTFQRFRADAQALWDESFFRTGNGEPTKFYKFVHFWMLVARSFVHNRCLVRAAALSFFALLALIPMFAVAISVTSSLLKTEGEDRIYQFVDKFVSTMIPVGVLKPEEIPGTATNHPAATNSAAPVAVEDTNNVASATGSAADASGPASMSTNAEAGAPPPSAA